MEKSFKPSRTFFLSGSVLILILFICAVSAFANPPGPTVKLLEDEIGKVLAKTIPCKRVEVRAVFAKEKPDRLKNLAIQFDQVALGRMVADYMTILYEDPVIDLTRLKQSKELLIRSSAKNKVSILISAAGIERYLNNKAGELKKKTNRISVKFSPPYIECLFDVPAGEISAETLTLLKKFIKKDRIEGYAAFQMKVNNNQVSAFSNKVIVNHFLIPDLILKQLQTKFNPFDVIPLLKPLQYSINTATVQNKYLFLTN